MTEIPSWVYLLCLLVAGAAAVAPSILRLVKEGAPALARPAPQPSVPAGPYSRAAWINQLCDLTTEAERAGQADVATASRALIAALVAVKEAKS